jgi:hypothetical protein
MLPKLKKSKLGDLLGVVCSLSFQNMTLPCYISKQNLADSAANTKKSDGELLCKHRNFPANKMIDKMYFL